MKSLKRSAEFRFSIFYAGHTPGGNRKKYAESDWYDSKEEAVEVMNSSFPSASKVLECTSIKNNEYRCIEYHEKYLKK